MTKPNIAPNIAIISGSHRPQSQSQKVAEYLANELNNNFDAEAWVYAIGQDPLPLWDEGMWGAEGDFANWGEHWQPLAAKLQAADGVVVIAPEWNGTAPAALKNFMHLASGQEFAHKAGLIVSVSAGNNGVYPIAELRSFSSKNNKLCYIPDHLIIRHAGEILNAEPTTGDHAGTDSYIRARITYTLNVFLKYTEALKTVRASNVWHNDKYNFGM